MKLQKSLYGYIKEEPIFYENIYRDLQAMGFGINPYGPCVINNVING